MQIKSGPQGPFWEPDESDERFSPLDSRHARQENSAASMASTAAASVTDPPCSSREKWLAGVVLAGILCVFFHQVVFLGKTLRASALARGITPDGPYQYQSGVTSSPFIDVGAATYIYEALTEKVRSEFLALRWPLWNDDNGAGTPLAANMESAPFFPLRWPLIGFPRPGMWDLYLLFRPWLAGLFTYLFLRRLDVGWLGAYTGAVTFMLSGYFIRLLNVGHIDVDCLQPMVMYAAETLYRERTPGRVVGLAVATSLSILGGMPESTFFVLVCAGVYYLYRCGWRERRAVGYYAAATAAGFLLSAVLLVIFLEYLGHAWTVHAATGVITLPIRYVWSLFFPFLYGPPEIAGSPPRSALLAHVGWLAFLLGLNALRRKEPHWRIVVFFAAMQALLFLKWYGIGINWIGQLPLLRHLIFTKYTMLQFAFGVGVLAGIGVHFLAGGRLATRRILLAGVALGAGAVWVIGSHWSETAASHALPAILWGTGLQFILLLALGSIFWALRRGLLRSRPAAIAASVLVTIEMGTSFTWRFPNRVDSFRPAPYVEFLRQNAPNGRTRVFSPDWFLMPNISAVFDLDDIRIHDGMYVERYLDFIKGVVQPSVYDQFLGEERPRLDLEHPALDLLNVRYLLVNPEAEGNLSDALAFHGRSVAMSSQPPHLERARLTLGGQTRRFLKQPAPSRIEYTLTAPRGAKLVFSPAIDPQARVACGAVEFAIELIDAAGGTRRVFSRTLEPASTGAHRGWEDASIDLAAYADRAVRLAWIIRPAGAETQPCPGSGWGDLRMETPKSLRRVYEGEVRIYENTDALPRAYLVHHAEVVADRHAAMERLRRPGFDFRTSVLLEEAPATPLPGEPVPFEPAEVLEYRSNRVCLQATTEAPALLVLTDTFYPGWKASVDGRPTKIYAANAAFRAVEVPAGVHRIEFSYEPWAFRLGAGISLLALAGMLVYWRWSR